jgi:CubicO group peptidase (beta-lactamase class C family)/ketosteroid isomerase-like protein
MKTLFALLFVIAVHWSGLPAESAGPRRSLDPAPRPSPEQLARVDVFVLAEQARQKIPGVAVAVIWNGEVLTAQGYGEANVEHHVPVTPDTIFQSGSVGKQFTAAAVMLLVEDGRLSLDDALHGFFPDVPSPWRGITVQHLLTHTSGIPDYTGGTIDYRRDHTAEELRKLAFALTLEFPPGSRWNYSNTGYVLLGQIIEKAGGKFYGEVLAERVFGPLGMRTARVISEADIVPNRAAGYELSEGRLKNQDWVAPSLNTTADGSLYLSLRDLIAWDRGIRDGRVLKPESWTQALAPVRLASGRTYPYGFGWSVETRAGHRVVAHGGSWQGFKSFISRYPDDDLSVIVLANLAEADPDAIEAGVTAIVNPALKQPELTAREDPDPAMRARVERLLADTTAGRLRPEDFGYVRAGFFPDGARRYAERLSKLGAVKKIAFLDKEELGDDRVYAYEVTYEPLTLRLRLGIAPDDRIAIFDLRPVAPLQAEKSAPQPAGSDTRAEIIRVLQRSAAGWNAGDLDAFMEPYDTSATFMTSDGPIDRPATRERYVRNFFAGGRPEQQLTFDELQVRLFGSDVALMTGRFLLAGGGKPDNAGRFSLVWRRTAAGWKIVHDHTS